MSVHRIHLKGPWEYEWISSSADGPRGRVTMPADWQSLFGEAAGRARFVRTFHRPSNLDDETVWLTFDGVGGEGPVTVNGVDVGRLVCCSGPQRFDVTPHLQFFSELAVELQYDPQRDAEPGGLFAPVALEIAAPGA